MKKKKISNARMGGTVDWGDDKTADGVSCNEIEYTGVSYGGRLLRVTFCSSQDLGLLRVLKIQKWRCI